MLSPGSGSPGGTASLSLSLANSAGTQPAGLQWTLNYPTSSISGITVTAGPALTGAAKTIDCAGSGGAYTCLATGVNSNIVGDGVVANVQLSLTTSATNAIISLSNALGASLAADAIPVSTVGATLTVVAPVPVLNSLTCNPVSLQPQQSSTCAASLSGIAGIGGVVAAVSTTGGLAAPVTVTIPSGANSNTITVTAGSFTTDRSATVTATLNGVSRSAGISLVVPVVLSSVSCAQVSLGSGAASTCTVTISKGAPANGTVVALAANSTSLTIPTVVTVAAGSTSADFSATAGTLTSDQTAIITASLAGVSKTASLSLISPVALSSVLCTTTTLATNASTTCTVTLSKAAPSGGTLVALSDNNATLTVPVSVTVPANASSATFSASAGTLTADQSATITASLAGVSKTATLSLIAPVALSSVLCTTTTLAANTSTTCTVALSKAAPAGGTVVKLSSSTPVLTILPSVTVAATFSFASFTASAGNVASDQTATITASLGSTTAILVLSLKPAVKPAKLSSLGCPTRILRPGLPGSCTVSLEVAGARATITLTSSNKGMQVPATVTIPAGSITTSFGFTTSSTLTGWTVLTASLGTVTKMAIFTAQPARRASHSSTSDVAGDSASQRNSAKPLALSCNPRSATAGETVVCELQLTPDESGPGRDVSLSSDRDAVKVPSSVPMRSGQSRLRFEVTVAPDARQGTATIVADIGGESVQDTVLVLPSGAPNLSTPEMQIVKPGSALRFKVTATDSQDLPVTLSAAGLPKGARFDVSMGTFEWTPSERGVYEVVFTATNSVGGVSSRSVTLDVDSENPVVTGLLNGVGKSALSACSPGAIARLTGKWLSTAAGPISEPSGTLTELGGTRVLVNGSYAQVLSTSGTQVDFLCPAGPPQTALDIALETALGRSDTIHTVMQETAPGILLADPERGQALAAFANSSDLVAVANFRFRGQPAVAGDVITIWTTGITCSENSNSQPPRIRVGPAYAAIRSMEATPQYAGVCQITFAVPASPYGDAVPVILDVTRSDGTSIVSNSGSIAIEIRR